MLKFVPEIVLVLLIFLCGLSCNGFPLDEEMEGQEENSSEIEAEYPVQPCTIDASIRTLKSLSNNSEDYCSVKDNDINFWVAACSCFMDSQFPCPSCPDWEYVPDFKRSTSNNKANLQSPNIAPGSKTSPKTHTKSIPHLVNNAKPIDEVDATHGKLIIRNSSSLHPNNNFIRFG